MTTHRSFSPPQRTPPLRFLPPHSQSTSHSIAHTRHHHVRYAFCFHLFHSFTEMVRVMRCVNEVSVWLDVTSLNQVWRRTEATTTLHATLKGHTAEVLRVAFLPPDFVDSLPLPTAPPPIPLEASQHQPAPSPPPPSRPIDADRVVAVTGGADGTVCLWEIPSDKSQPTSLLGTLPHGDDSQVTFLTSWSRVERAIYVGVQPELREIF